VLIVQPAIEAGRIDTVEVVEVIRVNYTTGLGTEGDPYRMGTVYYTTEGTLIVNFPYEPVPGITTTGGTHE
jgi:hypothetical protein